MLRAAVDRLAKVHECFIGHVKLFVFRPAQMTLSLTHRVFEKRLERGDTGKVAIEEMFSLCRLLTEHLARLRRREFAAKWRFNRTLRRLVGRGMTVELAGLAAAAAPWLLRRTVAFAGDVPAR